MDKPEALRLAELLDRSVLDVSRQSADELRRLYAENDRLKRAVTAMAMTHDKRKD